MSMHTVFLRLRSIVFVLCLIALSQAHGASGTVLVMGDSLSAAYGVETDQAWVALLEERLADENLSGWTIVNASVSGETTDGGLRRLPDLLSRHAPEIVILELGGNDGLRGFPPDVIEENLQAMIRQSQAAGARVLLLGMQIPPNYGERYTKAFADIYPQLAESESTALVPFFLDGIFEGENLMQDDGIHPTQEAQPILLKNVWPQLEPLMTDG
ncbi:MAG: arylesterase [Marinobacter sp.]|uniref:arylesterase n=1 Tax=Marinobacter sp. TaxID=50741 RepID=UPI00349FEE8A